MQSLNVERDEDGNPVKLKVFDTGMRHEYFDCICDTEEHMMRFTYFVDEWNNIEEDEVYITVFLRDLGFWHRLKQAVKHVFGYLSRYDHWECTTIKRVDAVRLRDLLDRYINSGLIEVPDGRSVKIVEKGDDYVVLKNGTKVYLLADEN